MRGAGGVVAERRCEIAGVLQRLAERVVQVEAVVVAQVGARHRLAHRPSLGRLEPHRLQVGEAPVGLAEAGRERDGAAIGGDGVGRTAGRLQRVPVAQPDLRLAVPLGQHALVELDGAGVLADQAERRGHQVAVVGIGRVFGQQALDVGQRRLGLVLAMQHDRQVVPRAGEARGQLQAVRQQRLGVAVAADAGGELGQHADRRDVGRRGLQVGLDQPLGLAQPLVAQRPRRRHQRRIAHRGADVLRVGRVGAGRVAGQPQLVGQRAPGARQLRIQRHRAPQRRGRRRALPGGAERQRQLVLRRRGARGGRGSAPAAPRTRLPHRRAAAAPPPAAAAPPGGRASPSGSRPPAPRPAPAGWPAAASHAPAPARPTLSARPAYARRRVARLAKLGRAPL